MEKLISGIHKFQADVFAPNESFFHGLADSQAPQALFITCSDSRLVPDLICQTRPGELFVLRNAGNIVPPVTPGAPSGEAATIEYAIRGLGVRHIVLCGHTRCGAMKAVIEPQCTATMPRVRQWLDHAQASAEIVCSCYSHLTGEAQWKVLVQENVLVQLEHLRTHPAVATALARGELKLYGWVYKIETGEVFAYRPESGQFTRIEAGEDATLAVPAPSRPARDLVPQAV